MATAQTGKNLSYPLQEKLLKANQYYKQSDYKKAVDLYLVISQKSGKDTSIMFRIAYLFKKLNDPKNAEEWYKNAIKGNEKRVPPFHRLCYAEVLVTNGKYTEALRWFKEYAKVSPSSDLRAKEAIQSLENIADFYTDSALYNLYPFNLNTPDVEFATSFYKDGLLFLANKKSAKQAYLTLFFSRPDKTGIFTAPETFDVGFKTSYNQGPIAFYDHFYKVIFSQNSSEPMLKKTTTEVPLQLFQSHLDANNYWVRDSTLSFVNTQYSYTQPCVSQDGKILYFVSNMPGGRGGTDLYMSKWNDKQWGAPINLGPQINTPGDEMFPYLSGDSILYFSSNGHGGLGGLDIFKTYVKQAGQPENMGAPFNSPYDDFGILLNQDGRSGYFSSNRKNGAGADDIYKFKLFRRNVEIKIIDDNTSLPIENAEISGNDPTLKKVAGRTDQDGNCTLVIPIDQSLQVSIKKENYTPKMFSFQPVNATQGLTVIALTPDEKFVEMQQRAELNEINTGKIETIPFHIQLEGPQNKKTQKSMGPLKTESPQKKERVIITDEHNMPVFNPQNVIYKVQIFASRLPANEEELKLKYTGNLKIHYFREARWYKYTIGEFNNYTEAKHCLYSSGVSDAFILAYIDNRRVRITVAKSATNETGVEKPDRMYFMKKL
jgi:tetratricopeptide (TPR) repeat protein